MPFDAERGSGVSFISTQFRIPSAQFMFRQCHVSGEFANEMNDLEDGTQPRT
jgi:hypothetical protein